MPDAPLILWFRRDLRVADNPMLTATLQSGRPLIPVFVLDPETEALGAAPKWRLGLGVDSFADRLDTLGSRLVQRRGDAAGVLAALAEETGAYAVHWTRLHDPASLKRDAAVERKLVDSGVAVAVHQGHLLREPEAVETKTGGYYKVYTPFWNTIRAMGAPPPEPSHRDLHPPKHWPKSDALRWGDAMKRGAAVVANHVTVGELAAGQRLRDFLNDTKDYAEGRDFMARPVTSDLSENLTYGEIGPRTLWHAGLDSNAPETFLRELVWREFAHHLLFHNPHLATKNWREGWVDFPWRSDNADAEAWRRGMTGESIVDAAMRELFVTGTMHNRSRMIAASFLTKHLLVDWRIGLKWFEETLIDWDPASNAMNWQWVAGCGPDASPYFRIFNPATQAEKFDADGKYRDRWLNDPAFFDAAPPSWKAPPPKKLIGLAEGRARALEAYQSIR